MAVGKGVDPLVAADARLDARREAADLACRNEVCQYLADHFFSCRSGQPQVGEMVHLLRCAVLARRRGAMAHFDCRSASLNWLFASGRAGL